MTPIKLAAAVTKYLVRMAPVAKGKPMFRRALALCCSVILPHDASAQMLPNLGATIGIEAGIDPATRDFLNRLPELWRKQIEKLVKSAFDRADKSIYGYLSEVDRIITSQTNNLQCHIFSTTKGVLEQIKESLPFASTQSPIGNMRALIKKTQDGFSSHFGPIDYKIMYDDLMLKVDVIYCQAGNNQQVKLDVENALSVPLRQKWLVWNRLEITGCKNAEECFDVAFAATTAAAKDADPRDAAMVNATAKIANVSKPAQGWFPSSFRAEQYEERFQDLFAVIDAIDVAKTLRKREAVAKLNVAGSLLDHDREIIASAEAKLIPIGRRACSGNRKFKATAASALDNEKTITEALEAALTLDAETRTQVDTQKARISKLRASIKRVQNFPCLDMHDSRGGLHRWWP